MENHKNQKNSLTADHAKAILQFLQRTQMQGAEMPVYVDLFNVLSAIAGSVSEAHGVPADDSLSGTG